MNNSWNSKENSYCIFSFITNYWPKFHYFDYVICCGCYFQQATLHKTLDASPLIWTESKFTKTNCKCNRIPKVGQQNFKASPHQMPNFASHQFFSLCLRNWDFLQSNHYQIQFTSCIRGISYNHPWVGKCILCDNSFAT